jgi:hypothetical protein
VIITKKGWVVLTLVPWANHAIKKHPQICPRLYLFFDSISPQKSKDQGGKLGHGIISEGAIKYEEV